MRASWDLLPVAAVKEFLACGRPCLGWPHLPVGNFTKVPKAGSSSSSSSSDGDGDGGCLTTLTLSIDGPSADDGTDAVKGRLVIHGTRPSMDALACEGLAALPLRALDCIFLLLPRGDDPGNDVTAPAATASALAEIGRGVAARRKQQSPSSSNLPLVFVVAPGRVAVETLVTLEEAGAPWGLSFATLRQLRLPTPQAQHDGGVAASVGAARSAGSGGEGELGPHVLEAARAVCGEERDFVVVQMQDRVEPWEQAARHGCSVAGEAWLHAEQAQAGPSPPASASPPPPATTTTTTRLLQLIETSLFLAQPPSPPHAALAAEDLEYLRPPPPAACALHLRNYHDDWRRIYPGLQCLLDAFEAIKAEALGVAQWTPWPEYHFRDGGAENDWRVVPFLHTFPASDPSRSVWIESTAARCPHTVRALKTLRPHVRTALFSRLGPDTRLSAHTGWEDLANHVLRVHLTLAAPKGSCCGAWVEGEVRCHRPREFVVFDDSKVHKAFNLHPTEARIVLILDMARPPGMAPGVAVGGHTAELDRFISAFR